MTEAENVPPISYQCGVDKSLAYSRDNQEFVHGLPRQFVKSMRTLFDMLDDRGTGEVELCEIERRWRDDAVPNLPGVLDALRAVAPSRGLLTFDNFVSGLRLALHKARHKHAMKARNISWSERAFQSKFSPNSNDFNLQPLATSGHPLNNVSPPWSRKGDHRWQPGDRPTFIENRDRCELIFATRQNDSRPSRRFRHRRSNSGPICTARVLPNVKQPSEVVGFFSSDDMKVSSLRSNESNAAGRHAVKDSRETTSNAASDNWTSPYPVASSDANSLNHLADEERHDKQMSNLDQMTASTLFIDEGEEDSSPVVSVQPIVVSGKYIGITGTLKRTKSSTSIPQRRYGSLHRPTSKGPEEPKARPVASSSLNSLSRPRERREDESPCEFRKYEPSDETSGLHRKRTIPKRDPVYADASASKKCHDKDGYGRRCNSASPPDVPVEKSARSSRRIERGLLSKPTGISLTTSPDSSASSSYSSPGTEDGSATSRRRRANSASNAQRRRNARWNTAVVALDSPTMKYLKEIQQKQDLLTKGLESVGRIKNCFDKSVAKIRDERDRLNSRVEGSLASESSSSSVKERNDSPTLGCVSSEIGFLNDIIKQFQSLEGFSDRDLSCNKEVANLRQQNTKLSKEVNDRSEQIYQLEQEKAALVRQLFQARSELQQSAGSQVDTSIFI